jgi:glycosyltransferase involved in cell wall biosynthesis
LCWISFSDHSDGEHQHEACELTQGGVALKPWIEQNGQVCLVTSHFYPELIGGEETFIRQFCRYLESNDVPYTVISASTLPKRTGLKPISLKPFSLPLIGSEAYSLLWTSAAILGIVSLHSERRLGIIHAIDTGYGGLAGVFAARLLRLPLIVHSHGRRSEGLMRIRSSTQDWRTWPYWAIEKSIDRFVVSHASKAIAVSEEVASFLVSLGVPGNRILIVPSTIELDQYSTQHNHTLRSKLGIREDSFVIGFLGRLERLKGVEVLFDAYARFEERCSKESYLLIAGDGPLRRELEGAVAKAELSNVKFLGFQTDAVTFLKSVDVLVVPSFIEGSPLVLLESMAAGCAIVASNIAAVREMAKESILLFPAGDSSALSEILIQLEANPELRVSLSLAAKQASRKFSTEVIFPNILELYSESLLSRAS